MEVEHADILRAVYDSLPEGIIVVDKDQCFLYANKALPYVIPLARLPQTSEEKPWLLIEDKKVRELISESIETQSKEVDREMLIQGHSGTPRPISLDILPLAQEGSVIGSLIVVRNLEEKRRIQLELRRAKSLASFTNLAAGVAHEIKNPLGAMSLHIQLMQRELKAKGQIAEDSGAEYLQIISEEIERLNSIVVDFLFAVRPMDLQLQRKNPEALCEEVLSFLSQEFAEGNIRIRRRYAKHLPEIDVDPRFFKQALLNLLQNAKHAMGKSGVCTITTSLEASCYAIRVRDNGMGIAAEHQEQIFDPYFTTKETGTGLGLSSVYKIMQEHGGQVLVRSEEGKGSEFVLLFPLPPEVQARLPH